MLSFESNSLEVLPILFPEQYEAGREIAEYCDLGEDILGKNMLWNGYVATVEYGLAHSAQHMDFLTKPEIRKAVFDGVAAYESSIEPSRGD